MSDMNIIQTELANRTGLKQPNINRVLSGKQSMQLSTLEKMPKDFSS
jgi:predicted transcriptional regulator